MKINQLNQKPEIDHHLKLKELYLQFELLLSEIRKKEVTDSISLSINKDIEELNSIASSEDDFRKLVKKKQTGIIKLLEKDLKLVPKNYYRNLWLALGMSAFGLPLGVAFGAIIGNMAFLGLGLPIGMVIGIAVGTGMDKKAFKEGRQLDLELKY
jgi:hypothetical protein